MPETNEHSLNESKPTHLVYGLDEKVPLPTAAVAGFQQMITMFVGNITPPLIIASALKLPSEQTAYLISMALFAAGIATLIQVRTFGPLGSGLLSVAGTSFAFLQILIQAGQVGGLALMFGMSLVVAPIQIFLAPFVAKCQKVFTPLVSGTVVMLIGLSLIPTAMGSIAQPVGDDYPAWTGHAIAMTVILIVVGINAFTPKKLRMWAILISVVVGYILSASIGILKEPPPSDAGWLLIPQPLKFGFDFDWSFLIPFMFIYLMSSMETIGDLTATSEFSGQPTQGPTYWKRIKGGLMGDGFNSSLAALFNAFPNTTFSQNNAVIQVTGIASRRVGYFVAAFLILFGLFPLVGRWIAVIPPPVLGGVTLLLFGFVSVAGIRILTQEGTLNQRKLLILALALAVGVGVQNRPNVLEALPDFIQLMFSSSIAAGGITALILNIVIPQNYGE